MVELKQLASSCNGFLDYGLIAMRRQEDRMDDRIKHLVDEALLAGPSNGPNWKPDQLLAYLGEKIARERMQPNVTQIVEHLAHLVRLGALALAPPDMPEQFKFDSGNGHTSMLQVPRMILTTNGRKLLKQEEASPHHRARYLESIRARLQSPDSIIMTYIEEAIGAWEAGLYRSAAVMTGCACERLIHLLASGVINANHNPWSERLGKAGRRVLNISDIFAEVREALQDLAGNRKLTGELGDALDRKLSAIFDHVRIQRNQAGHPTGEEVSAEDAEAGLLLFPGFYFYADRLVRDLHTLRT